MEEIKPGDIVSLKSDDKTLFTVGYVREDKIVGIYWFDHAEKALKAKDVPVFILTK